MRAFGAVGCVSAEQKRKMNLFLAGCRKADQMKRRAEIAALSDKDIQVMMADAIIEAAAARGSVVERDFTNKGLPRHRLPKNQDAAMCLARRKQPRLDAMLNQPTAA